MSTGAFKSGPPRGSVLVVDDDPIVLEVVKERLKNAGFEVHTRESALGTTQWIAQNTPNYVLLDINMPALGGDELARLLKKRSATSGTGVILHSSMPLSALSDLVRNTGAIGGITKGSDSRSFVQEFERIIAHHGGRNGSGH